MKSSAVWTTIVGTGSYIPEQIIPNTHFFRHEFYDESGRKLERSSEEIVAKFEAITGIGARRYVTDDLNTSDIAAMAADDALSSSGIDREELDYIIVAHNFGDISAHDRRSDLVPTLAARVKQRLGIQNPRAVAYDLPFGCPGWLQAMIQADCYIRSGNAERALVIGAETLSRVCDPHDRDSMIYADGAGACVVQAVKADAPVGIVAHAARSDAYAHAQLLRTGPSYNPDLVGEGLFIKMQGHKLYEYALRTVPLAIKECIIQAGLNLRDISKVLLHQANEKMDHAIVERLCKLFGDERAAASVMPMTISWLGNSSVATLPTLIDMVLKGKVEGHQLDSGQTFVFASVGAGMNVNAMVYKLP